MKSFIVCIITAAVLTSGCVGVFTQIVDGTTTAIADVNKSCASSTSAACVKAKADLNAASQAELTYAQIQSGLQTAQGETLSKAASDIATALAAAYSDILAGVGDVSATAAADLQKILGLKL